MVRSRSNIRTVVRFATICIVLVCVVTYHHLFRGKKREIAKEHNVEVANSPSILAPRVVEYQNAFASRKLLDAGDTDNCSLPREPHPGYNDSCSYVLDQCSGEASLVNYLSFVLCDLHSVQVSLNSYCIATPA